MLNKIKKTIIYYKVLYKGEILKKIEYSIKDFCRFFYVRNKLQQTNKEYNINCVKIDFSNLDQEIIEENKYRIFGDKYSKEEIESNFKVKREFWRKTKLSQYEDVKIIWEYNRLQVLLPIAIKGLVTKDDKYKKEIEELLKCWKENNEFEYTLNWYSNLEVAIRAINIALTLILMQDTKFNEQYSNLLYLHAKHIYNEIDYSDCCIPNNHVIGEATALLMLSKVIDCKENEMWYKKAIKILKKYINIITDEGTSKENSFSYQFFVTKMFILALCFVDEEDLFKKLNDKILKSLNILKYTIVNENEILNYGDNDDGFLYSIYMDYNIAKDIKEYYNLFFKNEINNETAIYTEVFKKFNNKNSITIGSEYTNKYIITKDIFIYNKNNKVLFFNAKNIEGHAHNDSLAISLAVNGEWIFYDSGTYSYNKSKKERDYYRGREAHSTIQLEQKNAIAVGSFRWLNKAQGYISYLKDNNDEIIIEGIIENWATRKLTINKEQIKIEDKNLKSNYVLTNWIINKDLHIDSNKIENDKLKISFKNTIYTNKKEIQISRGYLNKETAILYNVKTLDNNNLETKIKFKEK